MPRTPKEAYRLTTPGDVSVPADWIPITDEGTEGFSQPPEGKAFRGIRATGAGNVVAVMGAGVERTLTFAAGETRWGIFVSIVSATATGLEGAI